MRGYFYLIFFTLFLEFRRGCDHRDLRKDRKRPRPTVDRNVLFNYSCPKPMLVIRLLLLFSNRSFCRTDTSNRNNEHRDTCAHDTSIIRPCVGGDSDGYDDVTMTFLYAIRRKRGEENHLMEREETTRVSGKGHGRWMG